MSGGHFEYKQYHIDDIANSIEHEIEKAGKPKPPLIWKEDVMVYEEIEEGWRRGSYMGYTSYDEAMKDLKRNRRYKFIREYENDGRRIAEFKYESNLIEVREIKYQEYEDGGYYPEYTEETIQIFKDAVKVLRKAAIYTQLIDWLLSGDDGEESLKERLKEELKKLEEEE